MKKLLIVIMLLLPTMAQAQSLIVIGWDGTGWNNIEPLLNAGKLPNLEALINQTGRYPFPIDLHGKTDTKNSWTRAWTGYDYDVTKVHSNQQWSQVPYRFTIVNHIQKSGVKIGWFVSKSVNVGGKFNSNLGQIWRQADKRRYANPKKYGDDYIYILRDHAEQFIVNNTDTLTFLHLNPDHYGHIHGENSARYLYEFERADQILGDVMAFLPASTPILIISDHGFNEGGFGPNGHRNAGDAWGWTDLPIDQGYEFQAGHHPRVNMRDIGTTVLRLFDIDPFANEPTRRGKSLL